MLTLTTWESTDTITINGTAGNDTLTGRVGVNNIINGGAGADTMTGSTANDIYFVDNVGDTISDTGGTDEVRTTLASYTLGAGLENLTGLVNTGQVLTGNASANTITGGTGNDTIDGGTGADTMNGGAGNDIYYVDNVGDSITDSSGTDEVRTTLASYTLGAGLENLTGTVNTGQTLTGNGRDNVITGGSGNDIIDGGIGADTMNGGAGNDIYYVDNVGDSITDSSGTDEVRTTLASFTLGAGLENLTGTVNTGQTLTGNGSDNVITGGSGNDIIDGGVGADTMDGGAGNDIYYVDNAGDNITDSSGTDEVRTGLASYTLGSGLENLTGTVNTGQALSGNGLDNVITGGTGNDTIDGGTGADTMDGGAGNDIYYVDNVGDGITDSSGTDEVRTTLASYTLGTGIENLTGLVNTGQTLTGNGLDNVITGGTGNDIIDGGVGADTMTGGDGNDTYYIDDWSDVVVEGVGEGTDTIIASQSVDLFDNVENLTLVGGADLYANGNGLDNVIIGNSGANLINGLGGADTMSGGLGDDTYYVDDTGDLVIENVGEGYDTTKSRISYTLTDNVEKLVLTGAAAIDGTGNGLDNVIFGNSAANLIDGGAGADRMIGGDGDDTYVVDNIGDTIEESSGGGTDTVLSSIAYHLGGNVENLTLTGAASINATGNGLNNVITGNSGDNVLDGRVGADTMSGGLGNDTYIVDNAGDVVIEDIGAGTDTVQSSISYTLGVNVENLTLTGAGAIDGTGNDLANVLTGNAGNNVLDGGDGNDTLKGAAGNDTLIGGLGNDTLKGGAGNDILIGGSGLDTLDGGAGADTFVFNTGDTGNTKTTADQVVSFSTAEGDHIDLTGWDADSTTVGSQEFTFIGSAAFSGTAGELHVVQNNAGTMSFISGDTDGDGIADFMIAVAMGPGQGALVASDFILS